MRKQKNRKKIESNSSRRKHHTKISKNKMKSSVKKKYNPAEIKISDEALSCRFIYSGKGYGFAERTDGGDDIFIPSSDTLGAMTGDTVRVCKLTPSQTKTSLMKNRNKFSDETNKNNRRIEGKVCEITAKALSEIIGVVRFVGNDAFVIPKDEKLRVSILIESSDDGIQFSDGDMVEVRPSRDEYFSRPYKRKLKIPVSDDMYDTVLFGAVTNNFGSGNDKSANYMAILHSSGIPTEFPEDVLNEADEISKKKISAQGRHDLRDEIIFTIDGESAKDLDDAISIKKTQTGYILGVHIADVSEYVKYNSSLSKEAYRRGTSVYFTDYVIPMLPKALSNGCCSLSAGTDKYALSAVMTFNDKGKRLSSVFYKSIIRSSVRGVYSEINDLFALGSQSPFFEKYSDVFTSLMIMKELYEKLKIRAELRGSIELEESEAIIQLDSNGFPIDIQKRERGISERMIEQFMLEANMSVAEIADFNSIPCLFRVHEAPSPEKMRELAIFVHNIGLNTYGIENASITSKNEISPDNRVESKSNKIADDRRNASIQSESEPIAKALMNIMHDARKSGISEIISGVMLRAMMKAKYRHIPGIHFGIGAVRYCHFTSPIRRYPDLFVHTSLSEAIEISGGELFSDCKIDNESDKFVILSKDAADSAAVSTDFEMRAVSAERDIEALFIAIFMSDKVGKTFSGTVISINSFGIFIRLKNTVEGLVPLPSMPTGTKIIEESKKVQIPSSGSLTLGSKINAVLTESDIVSGKLTFNLIL